MSGMSIGGTIMVQEAQASGFNCHVYDNRLDAAIQLLRTEIRRSAVPNYALKSIEKEVAGLLAYEKRMLEDDT